MNSRTRLHLIAVLAGACAPLAAPAAGLAAGSGGSGLQGGAGSSAASSNPLVQPAKVPVSTSADGITLWTFATTETARALGFTGTGPASDAGQTIAIERAGGAGPESRWSVVADATIGPGGSFAGAWHATRPGRFQIEAVLLSGTGIATDSTRSAPSAGAGAAAPTAPGSVTTPPLTVAVYQSALATMYGPGFYGRETACGETLRRGTLGVASRTLACGTQVSLMFRDRLISVPVIDRGPYANGADWDLTMATARALGMRQTATIGALALQSTAS